MFEEQKGDVTDINIYTVLGELVKIISRVQISDGRGYVDWDGKIANGREAPAGVYLYRLILGGRTHVGKMIGLQ